MAENVLYADLNLPESSRPRNLKVPDIQGCIYAEVKVKPQDTNDATNCKSSGKSHCSRTRVPVLVAVLVVTILTLTIVVYQTLLYVPTAGSQRDLTTTIPEEALGCPQKWEKHGKKCYFSSETGEKSWNASREECAAMSSDLVIIDSRKELDFLIKRSSHKYYLLGLRYFQEEQKWKWINNMERDPAMFNISGHYHDYLCTVIGYGQVHAASCNGSQTTKNMCEKVATVSARLQKDS